MNGFSCVFVVFYQKQLNVLELPRGTLVALVGKFPSLDKLSSHGSKEVSHLKL